MKLIRGRTLYRALLQHVNQDIQSLFLKNDNDQFSGEDRPYVTEKKLELLTQL